MDAQNWSRWVSSRQKRNAELAHTHPVVYSLLVGSLWGLAMGLVMNRTLNGMLVWFVFGNILFGPPMVLVMRHLHPYRADDQE